MCSAAKCRVCGKTTWKGCGMHVEAVKATVPSAQWCGGKHDADGDGGTVAAPPRRSWMFWKKNG
jgi:hypothetical protein